MPFVWTDEDEDRLVALEAALGANREVGRRLRAEIQKLRELRGPVRPQRPLPAAREAAAAQGRQVAAERAAMRGVPPNAFK